MKLNFTQRNKLYDSMDGLIKFYAISDRKLPRITLDSEQFELFTNFNKPTNETYFYRRYLVVTK